MTTVVETNLAEFNATLSEYLRHTKLNARDAVLKKAGDFAFRVRKGLTAFKPEKGAIRTERLAALQAGEGLKVSKAARDYANKWTVATRSSLKTRKVGGFVERTRAGRLKREGRAWWKIAVDRELSIRESGRGFVGLSWRFASIFSQLKAAGGRFGDNWKAQDKVTDRLNRFLSGLGFGVNSDGAEVTFSWGYNRTSGEIASLLKRPREQRVISTALREARNDMLFYVWRKQDEAAAKLNLK